MTARSVADSGERAVDAARSVARLVGVGRVGLRSRCQNPSAFCRVVNAFGVQCMPQALTHFAFTIQSRFPLDKSHIQKTQDIAGLWL